MPIEFGQDPHILEEAKRLDGEVKKIDAKAREIHELEMTIELFPKGNVERNRLESILTRLRKEKDSMETEYLNQVYGEGEWGKKS